MAAAMAPGGGAAGHLASGGCRRRLPSRLLSGADGTGRRSLHSPSTDGLQSSIRRRRRCGGAPVQAALPAPVASLAGIANAAAGSLRAAIDPAVLGATVNASGKLFLICAAVGWLLRTGRIPNSTATVLSKVRRGQGYHGVGAGSPAVLLRSGK